MKRTSVRVIHAAAMLLAATAAAATFAANTPATQIDPAIVAAQNEYKAAVAKAKADRKAADRKSVV